MSDLSCCGTPNPANQDEDNASRVCNMPIVKPRKLPKEVKGTDRARLIRRVEKKWMNGTEIKYFYFRTGPFADRNNNIQYIEKAFQTWTETGIGLKFTEVSDRDDSMVRIGFLQDDGAWSYIGRDCLNIATNERTMNFGWDVRRDSRGTLHTPIHEIGHLLGFPHEHQNPFAGIVWDEEAVYRTFARAPNNWNRRTTFNNILKKIPTNEVDGSKWDPDSIMSYGFGAGLIESPAEYRNGLNPKPGLTKIDIETAKTFYPPILPKEEEQYPSLDLNRVVTLNFPQGSQKNYIIRPEEKGRFRMSTFGAIDSLLVLSEYNTDGSVRFIEADDDSGFSTNASIDADLRRGRRYLLQVRLVTKEGDGVLYRQRIG
jgi:hypothetical protein